MQGLALMARPRRGTLKRRPTKQGISYGVAFTYRGEEFYEHFGGEWEGWDEERAAEEQRFLIEKVNRGEWTPAKAEPARGLAAAASPSFQVEASQWLHRRKVRAGDLEGRSKTIRDLEWRLSVVMDKFGPAPIDELDFGLADELVVELCEERAAIEHAAAEGVPLMRTVRDSRTGTSYQARRRALSNGSIRKALDAAERVLRDAKKRGVLVGEVPALKSAAPKAERPRRRGSPGRRCVPDPLLHGHPRRRAADASLVGRRSGRTVVARAAQPLGRNRDRAQGAPSPLRAAAGSCAVSARPARHAI